MKALLYLALATTASALAISHTTPSIGKAADATVINTPTGNISVTPISDNIFRVARLLPQQSPRLKPSKAAVLRNDSSSNIHLFLNSDSYEAITPNLSIKVDKKTGSIYFADETGNIFLTDVPNLEDADLAVTLLSSTPVSEMNIYGGGERGHSLNLSGDNLSLYNRQNYGYTGSDPRISQMNISVPLIITDKGYGVLFDSHDRANLNLSDTITFSVETPAQLSYYIIAPDKDSKNLAGVTNQYTRLTGCQPLPPLWSLGYITSKYGYHNQNEAYGVIDTLHQKEYPVDGIVLDLYWYGVETDMGKLAWDSAQWPNHKQMLANLKDKGVNTVLITQPYINKKGAIDNYNFLSENSMLTLDSLGNTHDVTTWVGDAGMLDISNPKTAEWLWGKLRDLTAEGVAGWWGDLGEPEVHPESIRHHNGLTASQYHNQYGNDWSQIIYNGLKTDFPDQRPLLMMRGGTSGLQRFAVFPWTTDVSRSWGGLEPQVKLMLTSGLSGLGYMSSDLGGFAVDPNIGPDSELYTRWLQLGTFSPMMRTHSQTTPEPYHFPDVENISHKFIDMRYQWLPYNYSLAFENALYGWPLARPLNFRGDNPEKKFANIDDEYLWGDNVLVAPVLTKNTRSRKVTFPAGKWYNWLNPAQQFSGKTTTTIKAPLDQIPLFVRAGSFIAQSATPMQNVGQYNPQLLKMIYFPSPTKSTTTLYDDNRTTPATIENHEFQAMTFTGEATPDKTIITIDNTGGYKGMPETRIITIEIVDVRKAPTSVTLQSQFGLSNAGIAKHTDEPPQILRCYNTDKEIRQYGYTYNPTTHRLTLRFPWRYNPTTLTINP